MKSRHSPTELAVAVTALTLVVAACGAGATTATPTSPPSATTAPPSALVAITPTAASTGPTAAPTPSPSPLGAMQLQWKGSGPTQPTPCCQTWWPAINPKTGEIWVANSFGNEYWIFTPDGTFKEAWGIPGTGPAQFDFSSHRTEDQSVGAIAFAPDGSFYVADNGNRRIQRFDADRKYAGMWGSFGTADGQFANPFGIAMAGDTVYVADDDRGDVQAFTKGGTYLRTFGRIISAAGIFIAADKDGNLYRSGGEANSVISKYDPTGAFVADFDIGPPGAFAAGLAVDTAGNVYANIYSAGRIQLISLSPLGDPLGAWTGGNQTLAVDPSGTAVYEAGEQKPASLSKFALPNP